jgi:hypothetical protein
MVCKGCHFSHYLVDKEILKALETRSIADSKFWNVSISERNEMIFNDTQELNFENIQIESKNTFDKLIHQIGELSDDELNSEDYIQRKNDKRITWDFIGANNFWHYEDHEDALIQKFDLDYVL